MKFKNYYFCSDCDKLWQDQWDCTCDDKCPSCNKSYTPYKSIDIGGNKMTRVFAITYPDSFGEEWLCEDNLKSLMFGHDKIGSKVQKCITVKDVTFITNQAIKELKDIRKYYIGDHNCQTKCK